MAKIDLTSTTTRPDLSVTYRPSGAFIIKDDKMVPDLNDEAMKERAGSNKPLAVSDKPKDEKQKLEE